MRSAFLLFAVVLLFGVAYLVYQGQTPPAEKVAPTIVTQPQNSQSISQNGKVLAGKSSPYIEFNKKDYDEALNSDKIVLLNFYANWCPICRAEEPNLFEGFNSFDTDKVIAFRVNYKDSDTDKDEEALAKEFGVPYQHTKVILKDGKQIKKVTEQWSKEQLVKEINAVLE